MEAAVVVVVVVGGTVVVVVGGTVVVVVGGTVVVVEVAGARYATRCVGRSTLQARRSTRAPRDDAASRLTREPCGVWVCSRRGRPSSAPHKSAAIPVRLPTVLCFRRAPPFSGTSAPAPKQTCRGGF